MKKNSSHPRPPAISRAITALWAALIFGDAGWMADMINADISMVSIYPTGTALAGIGYSIALVILILAPFAYLIEQISLGKDWTPLAAMVALIVLASWNVPAMGHFHTLTSSPFWLVVSSRVTGFAFAGYGVWQLFTRPAQRWFHVGGSKR